MTGDDIRQIVAIALAAAGVAMMLVGAVGALRFADVYERIHAARAAGFGAPLVLAALAVLAWDWRIGVQLALIAGALALTAPAISHLIAQSAYRGGVEPAGRKRK